MTDLLDRLPDIARWVEARAMLLSAAGRVFAKGDSCVVRNEQPGGRLVVVISHPTRSVMDEALSDRPDREVLCLPEHEDNSARQSSGTGKVYALRPVSNLLIRCRVPIFSWRRSIAKRKIGMVLNSIYIRL